MLLKYNGNKHLFYSDNIVYVDEQKLNIFMLQYRKRIFEGNPIKNWFQNTQMHFKVRM